MPKVKTNSEAYLSDEVVQQLVNRLSRIEGQVRGVKRMISERKCCDEVLAQTAAVRAAIDRVTVKLVEDELLNCLTTCGQLDAQDRMARATKALSTMLKHS